MQYEIRSYPGERPVNEDCALAAVEEGNHCFVLCDGLGGHGRGEVASRLVAKRVVKEFHRRPSWQYMEEWIETAQEELLEHQRTVGAEKEMKTTLVVLWSGDRKVRWGHIGDSRLYQFRKGMFSTKLLRTFDHSVPQMLAASGSIKESEIRHHEDRNRLLRVMGVEWESPEYEMGKVRPIGGKQAFLLCSDGWWEWIEEDEMIQTLKRASDVGNWMEAMERSVREHGQGSDMDNFSAIGVWL